MPRHVTSRHVPLPSLSRPGHCPGHCPGRVASRRRAREPLGSREPGAQSPRASLVAMAPPEAEREMYGDHAGHPRPHSEHVLKLVEAQYVLI